MAVAAVGFEWPTYLLIASISFCGLLTAVLVREATVLLAERLLIAVGIIAVLSIVVISPGIASLSAFLPLALYILFSEFNVNLRRAYIWVLTISLLACMLHFYLRAEQASLVGLSFVQITAVCFCYGMFVRWFSMINRNAVEVAAAKGERIRVSIRDAQQRTAELHRQREAILLVRKSIEQSLRSERLARARLEGSREQLEQFAYAASHDLKEPVRTIRSFIQMARRRLPEELISQHGLEEHFEHVESSSLAMHALLEKLLLYSRSGQACSRLVQVSVAKLYQGALVESKQPLLLKEWQACQQKPNVQVRCDPKAVQVALVELISNAVLFAKPGLAPELELVVAPSHREGFVHIRLIDQGIGIDAGYTEHVFGLFKRLNAREAYPGAGLGLPLARRIIEAEGGRVWLTSIPGAGTTAHVELPAAPSPQHPAPSTQHPAPSTQHLTSNPPHY